MTQPEGTLLRLCAAEKVKTHSYGGGQQAAGSASCRVRSGYPALGQDACVPVCGWETSVSFHKAVA